ncbi:MULTISPECIES: hypothetical protein [unclassified Flavobacterium]|uniref:hypothetical protein n=1 Tax=unclassified Flavobacterium TaxID=196869 RepID=UPI0012AAA984|nr:MULTISPECIES: hypothetical protein [unclassified Flavobacterium]MBF4487909.1 hypothetical protein [Flavobacterium sp. CSZ]QGK73136.1 hypothetical protein GIY83_03375 [Flavobacterium sp. SLB02]
MEGRTANWVVKEIKPNIGSFEIVYGQRVVFKSWYDGKLGYNLSNGEKTLADQENFKDKLFKKNIFNELDYLDSTLYKSTVVYGDFKTYGKLTYFTTMRFGVDPDSQIAKIEELFYNEKISENDFK